MKKYGRTIFCGQKPKAGDTTSGHQIEPVCTDELSLLQGLQKSYESSREIQIFRFLKVTILTYSDLEKIRILKFDSVIFVYHSECSQEA